jgi:hypothetical protein
MHTLARSTSNDLSVEELAHELPYLESHTAKPRSAASSAPWTASPKSGEDAGNGHGQMVQRPPEPLLLQGRPGHTDRCSAASGPRANRACRNWQEREFMSRD